MLLSRVSSKDRDNRMSHLRIRVKFTWINVHKSISGNAKVYYVLTFVPQYADYFQGCIFISSCKTMNILFNYNFKIYRCQFACRFNSSAKVFIVCVFTVLIPTWDSHKQLLPQGPLNLIRLHISASFTRCSNLNASNKVKIATKSRLCFFCSFTNTIPIY